MCFGVEEVVSSISAEVKVTLRLFSPPAGLACSTDFLCGPDQVTSDNQGQWTIMW